MCSFDGLFFSSTCFVLGKSHKVFLNFFFSPHQSSLPPINILFTYLRDFNLCLRSCLCIHEDPVVASVFCYTAVITCFLWTENKELSYGDFRPENKLESTCQWKKVVELYKICLQYFVTNISFVIASSKGV